jgi:dTDP-4-amino-4,6-dideoxygalactose transaminase
MSTIPFNIPYFSGKEKVYTKQAIENKKLSGDGPFTKLCQEFFEKRYGFKKVLLSTSCTDALEMSAILFDIKEGDEVILPSYTFVSTANAFLLRGAKLVFADSNSEEPNINVKEIQKLITSQTKAIVIMHYAGIACDMDEIMNLVKKHNLFLVEDAALGLDSFYKGRPLGSFGHLATFSFHDTKNISCGEGGMLVINDERFIKRAEIIREKGTNRSAFFRGEVDKYGWADIGSSFLPSDLLAAVLWAQLEKMDKIQKKRIKILKHYQSALKNVIDCLGTSRNKKSNGSIFYLVCKSSDERTKLISYLKTKGIQASFHYQALHKSAYFKEERSLANADKFTDRLLRLPLYPDLSTEQMHFISGSIIEFFKK